MTNNEHGAMEIRISNLEESVGEIKRAVKSIDQSMQAMVRLEAHHAETRDSVARAFKAIEDQGARLRKLEEEAPKMRLVAGWVVTWVVGIVGLVGVALIGLVLGVGASVPGGLP